MRRLLPLFLFVFVVFGVGGPAASAFPPNREVIGRFSGQTVFEFYGNGCGFVYQTFSATYRDSSGGRGKFLLSGCVEVGGRGFTFDGTMTLTPPGGVPVGGTATGPIYGATPPASCEGAASLQFRLTPDTLAAIDLVGTWCPNSAQGGTILGVLSN